MLVSLTHPKAAGKLNQAPVTVTITTGSVSNALTVPVNALLAQPGGKYAVEVTGPGGHHLVNVTPGMFDDAAGQGAGQREPDRGPARRGAGDMSTPVRAAATAQAGGRRDGLVLDLAEVTKVYPGAPPVPALRGVDLAIAAGELVAVLGPSGSGKSTLLHLAGTLDRPSSGTVRITGLDVATLGDRALAGLRASEIGFVFQQFFLAEHASVLDNVADGLLYAGVGLAARRDAAAVALDRVGLGHKLRARPTQLSGGERQRVAIARALAGSPAIVLADEPTGNLDQATGAAILDLLAELHTAGTTIIVVTHDEAVAARMHRQVRMLDGRIVSDSTEVPDDRHHARARPRQRPGSGPPTWPGWPWSACAPGRCAPRCPRWASRSGWPRSSRCSACRPPRRPG